MKMQIAMTLVAAITFNSTSAIADEEMVVTGQLPSNISSVDQQAINACLTAFASKVQVTGHVQVDAAIPNYSQVFSKLDAMDRETSKVMEVEMNAFLGGESDKLLAKSVCTVSINAIVLNLSVDKLQPG